ARAVRVEWTAARIAAGEAGVRKLRQRRTRNRVALAGALAVAMAALVMWPRDAESPNEVASRAAPRDGVDMQAAPLVAAKHDVAVAQPAPRIEQLTSGKRTFETTTPLRVIAGAITIEAFSAKFAAARYEQRVQVDVVAGTVTVVWENTTRTLAAGDSA